MTNSPKQWVVTLLNRTEDLVHDFLLNQGACRIMLTGGRSASHLYTAWAEILRSSSNLSGIHFYFGDERCVPPGDPQSNYGLAVNTLFPNGIPNGIQFHRMEGDAVDLDGAAEQYATTLPESIDILLLSVGEDGHIASLFPHSPALKEAGRKVLPVLAPKFPSQRLTVTGPFIRSAKKVLVMAVGKQKRRIYEDALTDPGDIDSLPARLVLDSEWFFGE